jgi:hypothetical protein
VLHAPGLDAFVRMAALALPKFRRINGVTVDGLASRIVLAAGASASLVYFGALAAATWAAFRLAVGLAAVAAATVGIGCALGVRHGWHAQRRNCADARGASPRLLGGLAVLGCLALETLVVPG